MADAQDCYSEAWLLFPAQQWMFLYGLFLPFLSFVSSKIMRIMIDGTCETRFIH